MPSHRGAYFGFLTSHVRGCSGLELRGKATAAAAAGEPPAASAAAGVAAVPGPGVPTDARVRQPAVCVATLRASARGRCRSSSAAGAGRCGAVGQTASGRTGGRGTGRRARCWRQRRWRRWRACNNHNCYVCYRGNVISLFVLPTHTRHRQSLLCVFRARAAAGAGMGESARPVVAAAKSLE